MLQKLENFYLAILRFVVLLVAGLLLVAVGFFAVESTAMWRSAPMPLNEVIQVGDAAVKEAVLASDVDSPEMTETSGAKAVTDPNQEHYAKAAASILAFFNTHFPGEYSLDQQKIENMAKQQAEAFEEADIQSAYAKGLAGNLAAVLADPAIVSFAKSHTPGQAVETVIDSYTNEFKQKAKELQAKNDEAQATYLAEQASAKQSLYAAAAGFGIFLLIVFLSLIIKIERNLRPEHRTNI